MFFVNFTASFFLLPLAFVGTWGLLSYSQAATTEGITGLQCFLSILYPSLCLIPSMMIAGFGICGVYSVIQRLTLHTTSRYSEFWIGIKKNWKQFLISHFILGLLLSLLFINLGIFFYIDATPLTKLVSLIINVILLFLFLCFKGYVLFQSTLFNNSYIQILRNSVGFFGKRIGYNFLSVLNGVVMYVLILFLPGYFRIIPIVFIACYWLVFESLVNYLICIDTLEEKLPREWTIDFYHHGLEPDEPIK